jgi:hypothetical protein
LLPPAAQQAVHQCSRPPEESLLVCASVAHDYRLLAGQLSEYRQRPRLFSFPLVNHDSGFIAGLFLLYQAVFDNPWDIHTFGCYIGTG